MDKVDAEYLDEMVHSGNYGESSEQKASDVKVKDDGMSYEEILVTSKIKFAKFTTFVHAFGLLH